MIFVALMIGATDAALGQSILMQHRSIMPETMFVVTSDGRQWPQRLGWRNNAAMLAGRET